MSSPSSPTPHPASPRLPRRSALRATALATAGLAAAALLSGCSTAVALEPAPDATDPACADVIVRLPDTAADAERRETDAQATGAWGSPASVLLRCGVEPYGPTTLPCDNVNGVDWIRDDSEAPTYVFTTYGRTPAVQVVVDSNAVSGTSALVDLEAAVAAIPQTDACLNADDVLGTETTPTPTPTPTPGPQN
ncbi:DUF3515 domain-containing protein [Herbiconiux sp. KACC 21604]|uniref:DUF3515 domain-containing protein n=1 Tax=unclassified Herbiconiux TaxID=2618217 RepID=UPI0014927EF2|nr:DUF3515 domain-containing protein [Herbiconiux sp. SALV-R1]QJU54078.1 DUF3515 domain-containing protein [Herbiconiux sp. SALV-R1]WPO85122.1 DUF3515 domain-containing protein [Herbiconiux sp. KACC 21604]